jgi:hypothetical protein
MFAREVDRARWLIEASKDDISDIGNVGTYLLQYAMVASTSGHLDLARGIVDDALTRLEPYEGFEEVGYRLEPLRLLQQHLRFATPKVSTAETPSVTSVSASESAPVIRGRVTIDGAPQHDPESAGSTARRQRYFWYVHHLLANRPEAGRLSVGQPVGDGVGLEALVAEIAPIFARERSLVRWVALRGALPALTQSLGDNTFDIVADMLGVRIDANPRTGSPQLGLGPFGMGLSGRQVDACCGAAMALNERLARYDEIAAMSIDAANSDTSFPTVGIVNDAVALDFTVLAALVLHRAGWAFGGAADPGVAHPSRLESPGWHVEPIFSRAERFWDGQDWTPSVRVLDGGRYIHSQQPLRP